MYMENVADAEGFLSSYRTAHAPESAPDLPAVNPHLPAVNPQE